MKLAAILAAVGLGVLAIGQTGGAGGAGGASAGAPSMAAASAETYEHLATAVIALRQTEDGLVRGILMHAEGAAQHALADAAAASGDARKPALEAAATHITEIANEGDKAVQAIKQRLVKAGHHHHTDAETKEDYVFINSKEKKALLDLGQRVSQMGAASAADVSKAGKDLADMVAKALAAE